MLRYYSHQVAPSSDSIEACFNALRAASEREPEYGPVWSALATLHCQMWSFDTTGSENALTTALEFAQAFPDLRILSFDDRILDNARALGLE